MTKDEAKKLADLRNKMGAIYTHFQLIEERKKGVVGVKIDKHLFREIFEKNEKVALRSIKDIKKILDSFK